MKGVIFDVDGTLLDSMWVWKGATSQYVARHGKQVSTDTIEAIYSMSFAEAMSYIRDTYQLQESLEQVTEDMIAMVRDFYENQSQLKKGARSLLKQFQALHIPMACATSNDKTYIVNAFQRLGILDCFQKIVCCGEYHTTKASPEIYRIASEGFHAPSEQILVFEDALYAIKTAVNAGYITIGIADSTAAKDEEEIRRMAREFLPDFTFFSLDRYFRA